MSHALSALNLIVKMKQIKITHPKTFLSPSPKRATSGTKKPSSKIPIMVTSLEITHAIPIPETSTKPAPINGVQSNVSGALGTYGFPFCFPGGRV